MITPEQLETSIEYFHTLKGIARRLVLEGKAHVENGKLIVHEEQGEDD